MKTRTIQWLGIVALLLAAATVRAEQFTEFQKHVVHYNTIKTDFLSVEVASEYGIKRSRNRAMLSISVLDKSGSSPHRSMVADVRASATNLTGQLKTIEIREVREGDAIYYIGDFGVDDEEVLDFKLEVTPKDGPTYTVTFREQFFTR